VRERFEHDTERRAPHAVPAAAAAAAEPAATTAVTGGRLAHLDGMRAVASVYVVLFHAVLGFPRGELTGAWRLLKRAVAFGHEAVAVFIVLSGYCLMLPIVRRRGGTSPWSIGSFLARRAFRILPPYYAAVALSLLLLSSVPVLAEPGSGTTWDDSLPGLALAPIAAHLLLVHNWFPRWAFQINGPLWSVATEWQIYFFFPLLLLPLWRRFGLVVCLLVALAVGYAPLALFPLGAKAAIPWYLALFALGLGAAAIPHTERASERALWRQVRWGRLSLALWLLAGMGGWLFGTLWFRAKPLTDLLLGLATASFLVHVTAELDAGKRSRLTQWLESRPAVAIGHMSYSLYLTHLPMLALCHFALVGLGLSASAHALALLGLGTATSLGLAALFYLAIERPCIGWLSVRRREEAQVRPRTV
jgi:peptidoglycan/LPS O-acetylase OafA/YrhL